jgi:hypothetical protein
VKSYCRWGEGDLYGYNGADGYYVHVTGPAVVEDRAKQLYVEPSAQALLARVLWLGEQGCDYPWDALRWLKEDVVAEVQARELEMVGE